MSLAEVRTQQPTESGIHLQTPDTNVSKGPRIISGSRARLAGLLFVAGVLEACGSGSAANTEPSKTPQLLPTASNSSEVIVKPTPSDAEVVESSANPIATAEATSTPELTPKPTETAVSMPPVQELMNTLLNQPDKDVKSASIATIKEAMTNLWENNQESVLTITPTIIELVDPNKTDPALKNKPTLDSLFSEFKDIMEIGEKGLTGGELTESKRLGSVRAVVVLQLMYEKTTDPTLKSYIIKAIDPTYDFGVLVEGRDNLNSVRLRSNNDIVAMRSWVK